MNNRIQLLTVLKYILETASENEPVSHSDIISFLGSKGICLPRNTLAEDIKVIKEAGFDLITVKRGKYKNYYIVSDNFDKVEARLIADAVVSAKFVTQKKTGILIAKLLKLTENGMKRYSNDDTCMINSQKHTNCYTYYSIDVIQKAIEMGFQIRFKYFDLDENKNKVYRHNGKVYEVCPITLMNDRNNYYLIAYEPKAGMGREKSFRIDRMDNTELSNRKVCTIPFDFEDGIQRYRSSIFGMYSGMKITAEFIFDFTAMNIIYDKYGEDIKVTKLEENRYYAKLPIEDSPPFWGWLLMMSGRIRILSPSHLIEKYNRVVGKIKNQSDEKSCF